MNRIGERRTVTPRTMAGKAGRLMDRPRVSSGFTLVEVLVALVVAGILGAAVISLLMSQDRFYGHNDQHIYAQQTLRAAADLMASEIRMAGRGNPSDVVVAESDRVQVRFGRIRAAVCRVDGTDVHLAVYDDQSQGANVGPAGVAFSNPYTEDIEIRDDVQLTGFLEPGSCSEAGPGIDVRLRRNWSDPPDEGASVMEYGLVEYRFEASSFEDGLAVKRNGQELVAPLAEGASFMYLREDGVALPPPVSGMDLFEIRQIRVDATAIGSDARFDVERDLSYDIVLRN